VALLLAINLFNYVDRTVLASVESPIRDHFRVSPTSTGLLGTAFLVSYMVFSPLFGWLGDRYRRWALVAVGVIVWSLASGGTGLAPTFAVLMLTRCLVGVGEAAYGPVAPTIISDLYPVERRGSVLAWFYLAIPVGSAIGYIVGGYIASATNSWRWPFYVVVIPGILLGVCALLMREPPRGGAAGPATPAASRKQQYLGLLKNRSYVLDCAGMAAMTFGIGGMSFWMPTYIYEYRLHKAVDIGRVNTIFGGITVLAGIIATLLGGWAGDKLRSRFSGSYFLVSAAGLLAGFPMLLGVLYLPFPTAWVFVFLAEFCLFFNTGPSNTILANVTPPSIRATAFAVNIFVIHALGDAISPPVIGWIAKRSNMNVGFLFVGLTFLLGGGFWLWGVKYLKGDTERATREEGGAEGTGVVVPH
jgi:MFS transporter, Spinster family, sphingosine-1-phosphate transporter